MEHRMSRILLAIFLLFAWPALAAYQPVPGTNGQFVYNNNGQWAAATLIPAGNGGTGVSNTATLTLGTSNHNYATLGTGIIKNTTTTGALTNAAASDVVALFSGCSGTQYLGADGACHTGGGGGGDTITSPNSTLSVGGTSTNTTLDLNLTNANTWTALQTFNDSIYTNENSTTAWLAEQNGVYNSLFAVDTADGSVGIGAVGSSSNLLNIGGYQPATISSTNGTNASGFNFGGAQGGTSTSTTSSRHGGNGAPFSVLSGTGGTGIFKGGAGGTINITTGVGGSVTNSGSQNGIGGVSGSVNITVGNGTSAINSTSGSNTGGNVGGFSFNNGVPTAGSASGAALTNTGGQAGGVAFYSSSGGNATGGTTAIGGNVLDMLFSGGQGGSASGASGTNTGGNSSNIAMWTFTGGTGTTANGTAGGFTFQVNNPGTGEPSVTPQAFTFLNGSTTIFQINQTNLATVYGGITLAGNGLSSIVGYGRAASVTATQSSVATYTVGSSDGSFYVSANLNVTSNSMLGTIAMTFTYTDETNTSRTVSMNLQNTSGTISSSGINTTGPYMGIPIHIRAKASTAITVIATVTGGPPTFNVEGIIEKKD